MFPGVYASSGTAAAFSRGMPRVLVVDDDPDTVVTLMALLRDSGYDVRGHASVKAALQALAEFDPDVIVADIVMPLMTGWDLAREVRRLRGEKRPVMIAISGQYTKASDKILCEIYGFNYYLQKPTDPNDLLDLIKANTGQ